MPNHFHLVLEPAHQTALSQFHAVAADKSRAAISQALWQQRTHLAGALQEPSSSTRCTFDHCVAIRVTEPGALGFIERRGGMGVVEFKTTAID